MNIFHDEKHKNGHDMCFKSIVIDDKKKILKMTIFFLLYIWLVFSAIGFERGITLKRAGGDIYVPPRIFFGKFDQLCIYTYELENKCSYT